MRCLRPALVPLLVSLLAVTAIAQRPPAVRPPRPSSPGFVPPAVSPPDQPQSFHADDEGPVEFSSDTILVQVPVVVTDKAGQHVHSLGKDDFQIFENGKEQKTAASEEIISTHTPLAVSRKPGIFANLVPDRDKPRVLTVIALDTVNTPFLDQSYARRELVKYLSNNINDGQTLALVLITSKGLRVVHGLASSPAALQQELKNASGELPPMQTVDPDVEVATFTRDTSNLFSDISVAQSQAALNAFIQQGEDYAQFRQDAAIETTMEAFLGIAWSLTGIPGRKTLLWATGGFPFSIDSPSTVPEGRLSILYERAMQALNEAEVSVYPVDVQGLVNYSPDVSSNRVRAGAGTLQKVTNRAWLADSKQATLKDFAEMTGGKAFYNTNDLAGAFQRATDDGSSYYMLSYYLDTKNNKAGWRQLKVKLKGRDLEIRARKGFFVTNATMNPETTRINDMKFAMGAPFEATGIPIEMQWGPVKEISGNKEKKRVAFMLHVIGTDISMAGAQNGIDLSVVAIATKPPVKKEGQATVAASFSEAIKGNLKPENIPTLKAHGLTHPGALELESGTYSVRFVVRDNLSGRLGSLSAPVTVN